MKLSILTLAILLSTITSFCQDSTKASTDFSSLMKKSKNQKTTAWIFLGGGGALTVTGLAVGLGEALFNGESSNFSGALFDIGLGCLVTSIPLFIVASSTRKKAKALHTSFKWRTISKPGLYTSKLKSYPSFTVTLKL